MPNIEIEELKDKTIDALSYDQREGMISVFCTDGSFVAIRVKVDEYVLTIRGGAVDVQPKLRMEFQKLLK
jgi:hypothetical protein